MHLTKVQMKTHRYFLESAVLSMILFCGAVLPAEPAKKNLLAVPSPSQGSNNPQRMIATFTVSQWISRPEAMLKMAEFAHEEGFPVAWILHYKTALAQKESLDGFHQEYGDELIMLRGEESIADWHGSFPWARLNMIAGARPDSIDEAQMKKDGIEGIWGYCDQQIGIDGITHYGVPWGLSYLSPKTPFVPPLGVSQVVAAPWTVRDLHKCFHLKNAINFGVDPIEFVRSKTLDRGSNITFFQTMFDEWMANLPWNDRLYFCLHEEAGGPYIAPGDTHSAEGADKEMSESMYQIMRLQLRYIKNSGATITTLPEAVAEYKQAAKDKTIASTLLMTDKHHGSIVWYADPIPQGVRHGGFGPAGHFPDTLFYYDNECQLTFVHPEVLPRQILNYKAQYAVPHNKPYPDEFSKPTLVDWDHTRKGDERTYTYTLQSFYSMPLGLTEWGSFDGWQVAETNGLWAKIIDDRVLLLRLDLDVEAMAHNDRHTRFWVKLVKKKAAALEPNSKGAN
jgi:hypothetical protein